jgi:hypothetical protein
MQTQATNSTPKLTIVGENGSIATKPIMELDPWEIADLLICKRGEQLISIEFATDDEFDAWVKTNSIPIKENGISGWTFDDRCRLVNYVLANGVTLEFVDGTTLPNTNKNNSDNVDGVVSEAKGE